LVVLDERGLEDDLVREVTEALALMCARLYGRRSAKRRGEAALAAAGKAA
jgi:putative resolvase